MPKLEQRWYWDRRNDKAYYPVKTEDDTISFLSVWHDEEVEDAMSAGALTPMEETGFADPERPLSLKDSFRLVENPGKSEED